MLLGEAETQQLLDHRRQPHPRQPGNAGGQLGVKEPVRPHAQFQQAGEVLARSVQDPFHSAERFIDDSQVIERLGIDQPRAGSLAADLDQKGPLAVPVTGGPFGVDTCRTGAGGEGGRTALQRLRG